MDTIPTRGVATEVRAHTPHLSSGQPHQSCCEEISEISLPGCALILTRWQRRHRRQRHQHFAKATRTLILKSKSTGSFAQQIDYTTQRKILTHKIPITIRLAPHQPTPVEVTTIALQLFLLKQVPTQMCLQSVSMHLVSALMEFCNV